MNKTTTSLLLLSIALLLGACDSLVGPDEPSPPKDCYLEVESTTAHHAADSSGTIFYFNIINTSHTWTAENIRATFSVHRAYNTAPYLFELGPLYRIAPGDTVRTKRKEYGPFLLGEDITTNVDCDMTNGDQ